MNYRIIYSQANKMVLSVVDNDLANIRTNETIYTTTDIESSKLYFEGLMMVYDEIEMYNQRNKNKNIDKQKSFLLFSNNDYYVQNFTNKNYTYMFNGNINNYSNIINYNNMVLYNNLSVKINNSAYYSIESKINIRNIKGTKNIEFSLFVNGIMIQITKKTVKLNNGNNINPLNIKHETFLNSNDIVSIQIRNLSNTSSIDLIKTNLSIKEI